MDFLIEDVYGLSSFGLLSVLKHIQGKNRKLF